MITTYTKVGTATARSQQDSNFRLEEKLRDTNQWRAELQGEVHKIKMTVAMRAMRVMRVIRVISVIWSGTMPTTYYKAWGGEVILS